AGIVFGGTAAGAAPGFAGCDIALRSWIAAHGVECGLAWDGCLELVRDPTRPTRPIDWVDAGWIRLGASVDGGVLNPAQLLEAVMKEAVGRGALFVDGVTAETFDPGRDGVMITTSQGPLWAHELVMAVDATLAPGVTKGDPWESRGIAVALQTRPLGHDT